MDVKDLFAKLNRLRVNASMKELKSWKASKDKLLDAISTLQTKGFDDAIDGANPDPSPITTDPEVQKALDTEEPEVTQVKPGLSRGLGDEKYALHSRKAIQDHRRDERKKAKEETKANKKAKKLAKGEVDATKEPEKAARQQKHIADKKAKREAAKKPAKKIKKVKSITLKDEVTIGDIARELGKSPKSTRAKLRRHKEALGKLHVKGRPDWVFPKSATAALKKIIA